MALVPWQATIQTDGGDAVASAEIEVRTTATGTALATLYSDAAGTAKTNPFTTGADGFAQFWVAEGDYTIAATSGGSTETWTESLIRIRNFATIAEMAAAEFLIDGASYTVDAGANGEPETFTYDAGSALTADGALIVEATGMGAGRLVSARTEFASKAEMLADRRTFEVGTVLDVVGVSAYKAVTGASDEVNAGGQNLEKVALDLDLGLGTAAYEDATAFLAAPASPSAGDLLYFDGTDWVRLPKGTSGRVLTMGVSAPAWEDAATGGSALYFAEYTGITGLATTLPYDNTIPQSTEGDEVLSVGSVVVAAGQSVKLDVAGFGNHSNSGGRVSVALFRGGTCIGATSFTMLNTVNPFPFSLLTVDQPGAGTYTYSLRVGPSSAGTAYLNAHFDGTRRFGGAARTTLTALVTG